MAPKKISSMKWIQRSVVSGVRKRQKTKQAHQHSLTIKTAIVYNVIKGVFVNKLLD